MIRYRFIYTLIFDRFNKQISLNNYQVYLHSEISSQNQRFTVQNYQKAISWCEEQQVYLYLLCPGLKSL